MKLFFFCIAKLLISFNPATNAFILATSVKREMELSKFVNSIFGKY